MDPRHLLRAGLVVLVTLGTLLPTLVGGTGVATVGPASPPAPGVDAAVHPGQPADGSTGGVDRSVATGGVEQSVATDGPVVAVRAHRLGTENGGGNGSLAYDVAIEGLSNASAAWVLVPEATGHDLASLDRDPDAPGRFAWDGTGESASLTLRPSAHPGSDRGLSVGGAGWQFGPVPNLVVVWEGADGTRHTVRPFADRGRSRATVIVHQAGFVGEDVALIGRATTHVRDLPGGRVRLLVPPGVEPRAPPARLLDALETVASRIETSPAAQRPTTVVVLPASVRAGGATFVDSGEAWVNEASPLGTVDNVWLHEFVHARQSMTLAREMRWFREASAEYLAARLAGDAGLTSERAIGRHLSGDEGAGATLAAPGTWSDDRVAYTRGARVLAALDREIRSRTDDQRTLLDVFQRLNRHDGPVTREVFAATVSRVAGTDMTAWIDRHVAGPAPVAGVTVDAGRSALPGGAPLQSALAVTGVALLGLVGGQRVLGP